MGTHGDSVNINEILVLHKMGGWRVASEMQDYAG